jgi:hypothetical protein
MSSVVDFLEKMGSEAHWRHASQDDVEAVLADAGIEASMRTAILAKNATDVRALLGRAQMMTQLTPTPEPAEVPKPPQPVPGEEEEEQEDAETPGSSKSSKAAAGSSPLSSHSSP